MSYTDTSFTLASGYTAIHVKQVYDQFASQMSVHPAWSFVEQVNFVSGSSTTEQYVWKCSSAVSGLTSDFYVIFQVPQNVTGTYSTQYFGNGNFAVQQGFYVCLAEAYNSTTHVASKMATYPGTSSQTTAADGTNSSTWTLSTARPTGSPNLVTYTHVGPQQASTGGRLLLLVTATGIMGGYKDSATTPVMTQFYVGAFDSVMNSTDEPLPLLCMSGYNVGSGSYGVVGSTGSTTRHPKRLSYTGVSLFSVNAGYGFGGSPTGNFQSYLGGAPLLAQHLTSNTTANQQTGQLGSAADTGLNLFTGTVNMSRCCFTQYNGFAGNSATQGGMRGFLKNWLTGTIVAHAFGDTFIIDGKSYVGFGGQYGVGVMDTTQ